MARKIFFDGGCRPNPGMMETAVVVRGVVHLARDLGYGTNTDAEWLALLHALRTAHETEAGDFDLIGDSAVVIGQATGTQPCRDPGSRAHLAAYAALAAIRAPRRVRRIRRAQNLAGIALDQIRM